MVLIYSGSQGVGAEHNLKETSLPLLSVWVEYLHVCMTFHSHFPSFFLEWLASYESDSKGQKYK